MHNESFGQQLRQLRRTRDLTQEALAEQVGCAVDTLRAIENGRRRPSRELAAILAERLGVPPAERPTFPERARSNGTTTAWRRSPRMQESRAITSGQACSMGQLSSYERCINWW